MEEGIRLVFLPHKGWAVFRLAKEVWNDEAPALTEKDNYQNSIFFPIGETNP